MSEEFERLVTVAENCAQECEGCATACLSEKDVAAMLDCIRLDRDCADLCRLVATFAARHSRFTTLAAHVLASVCQACAEECSRHEMGHCQACAGACRSCVAACSALANA
jgi:hypothetical protein